MANNSCYNFQFETSICKLFFSDWLNFRQDFTRNITLTIWHHILLQYRLPYIKLIRERLKIFDLEILRKKGSIKSYIIMINPVLYVGLNKRSNENYCENYLSITPTYGLVHFLMLLS